MIEGVKMERERTDGERTGSERTRDDSEIMARTMGEGPWVEEDERAKTRRCNYKREEGRDHSHRIDNGGKEDRTKVEPCTASCTLLA
jgi:hypothetical protein